MFSGIIETIGTVNAIEAKAGCIYISIKPEIAFDDVKIGDSISVNGICLTVTHHDNNIFHFVVVPETLRLTNLGELVKNNIVNLERSITLQTRLGGHYVQGHIDGIGSITSFMLDEHSAALFVKISIPERLSRYVVSKGYITIDGMSITVIDVGSTWFTVTFIPHTQQITNVKNYRVGTKINIEVDMISKYVERLLGVESHVVTH